MAHMQAQTTFRGFGYTLHILEPQSNGSPAACGCYDAVINVRAEDIDNIPMSAICMECRRLLLDRRNDNGRMQVVK